MAPERFDVAVVGLGLIGAAATRHLAEAGASVVGIGPGEPEDWAAHGGAFASHYDSGRITRKLDPKVAWSVLAVRSMAEYPRLEAKSGITFHHPAGIVFVEHDQERISALTTSGVAVGADFTVDPPGAYGGPPQVAVAAHQTALREPGPAGFIDPRLMVVAQRRVAEAAGAQLRPVEVQYLDRVDGGFELRLSDGASVRTGQVLVAAGAFTSEVQPGLDLRPRAETVVLAELGRDEQARLAGLPSVFASLRDDPTYQDLYLVPPTSYPDGTVRLKMGATLRDRAWLPTAGERRAWMRSEAHTAELGPLRQLLLGIIPSLDALSWTTKPCIITDTLTGLPFVGRVRTEIIPELFGKQFGDLPPGLFVAAGGNGFAGKSADAIGALAAGLILDNGEWTDPDLEEPAFTPS